MGIMPMIIARAVMRTGRKRVAPASIAARTAIPVLQQLFLGKGNDENTVGRSHPHTHDSAHERGNAERGMADEEEENNPGQSRGQRGNDDERVQPGLKIDHDEQVHQNDREAQAGDQPEIRRAHGLKLPANRDKAPPRQ